MKQIDLCLSLKDIFFNLIRIFSKARPRALESLRKLKRPGALLMKGQFALTAEDGGKEALSPIKRFCRIPLLPAICYLFLTASCIMDGGDYFHAEPDPCNFVTDPRTGRGIRWDIEALPVTFYVHESVPDPARENFVSAIEHWNQEWEIYTRERGEVSPPALFAIAAGGSVFRGQVKNDSYNMLFFTKEFSSYGMKNSTQAVTKTYSLRRKIRDTDIIVNINSFDYYYDTAYNEIVLAMKQESESVRLLASSHSLSMRQNFTLFLKSVFGSLLRIFTKEPYRDIAALKGGRIPKDRVDFASLMIHELGHVPGLDHSKKGDFKGKTGYSVMDPKLAYGQVRRNIGTHDLQNLFCGYYGR